MAKLSKAAVWVVNGFYGSMRAKFTRCGRWPSPPPLLPSAPSLLTEEREREIPRTLGNDLTDKLRWFVLCLADISTELNPAGILWMELSWYPPICLESHPILSGANFL